MSVTAKFKVVSIVEDPQYPDTKSVSLSAVIADTEENKTWSRYTPCGHLSMLITNPDAFDQFEIGAEYYLSIKKA